MSYKVSKELKAETIQLMEEELSKKNNTNKINRKLILASLSVAMLTVMIVNQNQTETITTPMEISGYEFHSENTSNDVVTIYQDEYEMHLAKIKEYNPDYAGVIFGDDYYDKLTQEERDEINRSAAKRDYEYIIETEDRFNDPLINIEQKALLQEKFDSMELANPLKEWEYVSLPYKHEPYYLYGNQAIHHAYDLAADMGTPIYAMGDGVVTIAYEYTGSYGLLVEIDHGDGLISRYAHCNFMESKLVKVGDTVKAGQQIAEVGVTGNSTGPHLHFETRYKNNAFDIRLFDFNDESLFNFE